MKFKYTETVKVEKSIEVDDRLYSEHCMATKIVNLLFDDKSDKVAEQLYSDDSHIVVRTAQMINQAFEKADKILDL